MNCLNCYTINNDGATNCKKCGLELFPSVTSASENKTADNLLVTFIIIAFVTGLIQFAIEKFVTDWYDGSIKYLLGLLWVVRSLSFILVALSIKDKSLKTLGIVFSILLIVYWLYFNIQYLLR
jgi:uncharacterized membrane protein required for colicin V production